MTIEKVKSIINERGYIDLNENGGPVLYDWNNTRICRIPWATVERMKKESGVYEWRETWGARYVGHYLCKKYTQHENRGRCRRIAEDVDEYAAGRVYRCPECNHEFTAPEDCDVYRCPGCGYVAELEEYEQQTIYDYLDDCLDIEYRISGRGEFRSVQIMIAWGGPNIYLDTGSRDVELYWGGERETWPLSSDAISELDDWAEEYYQCL